jgi:uncharacterized protein (TIGR03437 family)
MFRSIDEGHWPHAFRGTHAGRPDGVNRTSLAWFGMIALAASAACQGQASLPSIKAGGVVSASAFGDFTAIAPGSWIEIYGSNLATNSRSWASSDFSGVNAPTSLDGTSVTIGGQAAFIDYISSGQVNAQVPSNVATGSQQVIVTTTRGPSAPYMITVNLVQPGLLAPSPFSVGGKQNVVALFPDATTYVLPPGTIGGIVSKRAKPGDAITLYGIGFGQVTPGIPAGQIVGQLNTVAAPLQIFFGSTPATFSYDGLAPSAVGLYQFNVTVPNIPGDDFVPLTFMIGGVPGAQTLYIAVQSNNPPQLQSVTLSAVSVAGGGTVQGTVALSTPAPAGGTVVALSSSSTSASVPAVVTVPAGATSAAFTVSTSAVSANQSVTITATYGGATVLASLTITGGGSSPQFSTLSFFSSQSSNAQSGVAVSGSLDNTDGLRDLCSGGAVSSTTAGTTSTASLQGSVFFGGFDVSGSTVTCTGLKVTASNMLNYKAGTSAQITSGSLSFTLNPQTVSTSGTVSGSINLVSTVGTITSSFTGTYTAR